MKRIFFISTVFLLLLSFSAFSQSNNKNTILSSYPDGFHIGLHTEGFLMQKQSIISLSNTFPAFSAKHTTGGTIGIELSYHFCHYFGASIGVSYGTIAKFRNNFYIPIDNAYYESSADQGASLQGFQIPINVEFHHPISGSNWFYYANAGINIINAFEAADLAVRGRNHYDQSYGQDHIEITINETNEPIDIFEEGYYAQDLKNGKIAVDLQLKAGLYYKLPYSDLIRFGIVSNLSFTDRLQGEYHYSSTNISGTKSYRHNYLGIEFGYIHCFTTKKR